jgi:hypothetical protein
MGLQFCPLAVGICDESRRTIAPYTTRQQGPGTTGFGRSNAPQPAHSWKQTHASVGIVSVDRCPQFGQVTSLVVIISNSRR